MARGLSIVWWVVERMLAAAVVCALTGLLIALGMTLVSVIAQAHVTPDIPASAMGAILIGVIWGIMFGTVPGTIVICLTPARWRPWRAIPILTLGTTIGCALGILTVDWAPASALYDRMHVEPVYVWPFFATVGGAIAAAFVRPKKAAAA